MEEGESKGAGADEGGTAAAVGKTDGGHDAGYFPTLCPWHRRQAELMEQGERGAGISGLDQLPLEIKNSPERICRLPQSQSQQKQVRIALSRIIFPLLMLI